jgi:hypothetical protein
MSEAMAGQAASGFTLPQDVPVSLPTQESLETMMVRRFDWHQVRTRVDQLKDRLTHPADDANTWAATCFAVSITATLGLIPIASGTNPQPWVIVLFGVVAVAAAIMGRLCLLFGAQARTQRDREIDNVCGLMDEIEGHHPTAVRGTTR